jgi:prevent-host-death family protein
MESDIISMHTAKSTLSQLVKRAAAGEVVYIGAYGRADVKLVPVGAGDAPAKRFGVLKGQLQLPPELEQAQAPAGSSSAKESM